MFSHRLKLAAVILVALGLVQCGKEGDSSKISFSVSPSEPVVINADLTLNPGTTAEQLVKAPWFRFGYSIHNGSDKIVTIVTLTFKYTSVSTTGGLQTGSFSIDPGNYGLVVLEEIAAGGDSANTASFYMDGLSKNAAANAYSVEVTLVGWFGDQDHPVSRLEKTANFYTH